MALEEYRRKRDFSKTAEPKPGKAKIAAKNRSYVIQKHEATRLHYDFRLELDGVLLSWAVTKGPSLDPHDKRLAVRTEDHPLEYGHFEGTIPKGQYGGGTVMLWDKGSWEPIGDPDAGLKKGHLSFILQGHRLQGRWDLVRMHGKESASGKKDTRENWLLVKKADEWARTADDLLEHATVSVTSGRSMEEIAQGMTKKPMPAVAPPMPRTAQSASAARKKSQRATPKGATKTIGIEKLIELYPEVQLATLSDQAPQGSEWLHEIKFDGYRLLGYLAGGEVRLRTRNGKDWTERFPSLVAALQKLNLNSAVFDMESVVMDEQGKSSFQSLQAALGSGGDPKRIVAYLFDLLYLNGETQTHHPLVDRKRELQRILTKLKAASPLRFSEHVVGQGPEMLAKACESDLEGIVCKLANAPYMPGRQHSWIKVKCTQRQEFIIVGYSLAHSGERALGALYLAYRKGSTLTYAGKVGTGFTMRSALDLVQRFRPLKNAKPTLTREETGGVGATEWRSIEWLKPELLCEVAFTEWTNDGRIRHPSFQGLREDKDAREVKKEVPEKATVRAAVPTTPKKAKHTAGSEGAKLARAQSEPSVSAPTAKKDELNLSGVRITHPDRIISEAGNITKGQLAEYYLSVADLLLPQIVRRPLSLLRCPAGVGGECFFQRNPGKGLGPHVRTFPFQQDGKRHEYLYIEDAQGLLEVIQMGTIELHPWGATIDAIDNPDRMIFDLDPAPEVPFEALKLAAQDMRQRLQHRGLQSALKCTGGKGLHVWVPLKPVSPWAEVKAFAEGLAHEMAAGYPEAYVATMSKEKRKGRIFIDYFRNDYTATSIADYSVRARPGTPVAVPLDWSELDSLTAANQFSIADVQKRITGKRRLPKPVSSQKLP